MEEEVGTTGVIVDLFNNELSQEEWNAIAIVHRLTDRLQLEINFKWQKSIDVRNKQYSQIVDESVFFKKEQPIKIK